MTVNNNSLQKRTHDLHNTNETNTNEINVMNTHVGRNQTERQNYTAGGP